MTPHRTCRTAMAAGAVLAAALSGPGVAIAQTIDMSHGGPVEVTARDGMEWRRNEQMVIANGSARAVRGNVTVTADRLIAHYRRKAATGATGANGATGATPTGATPSGATPGATPSGATPGATPSGATPGASPAGGSGPATPLAGGPATPPAGVPVQGPGSTDADTGSNEIYRLEAEGNVHIFTATDLIVADKAVYDIDQAVLLLTGSAMKLTTPQQVLTARDSMEYWSAKHMAVGRGMATVTTADGRRVTGDTLVGYTKVPDAAPGPKPAGAAPAKPGTDPLASSGKLERVEGFGNVEVRTATEVIRAARGVYIPDTGIARLAGSVHLTRGQNQLNGAEAIVNMRTGISTLTQSPGGRVQGLVIPNDPSNPAAPGAPGGAKPKP